MNIDEGLAQRVRETLLELADFADISERKMFGALMTMVNGHMTCGISGAKPGSKIRPRAQGRRRYRTGHRPGIPDSYCAWEPIVTKKPSRTHTADQWTSAAGP